MGLFANEGKATLFGTDKVKSASLLSQEHPLIVPSSSLCCPLSQSTTCLQEHLSRTELVQSGRQDQGLKGDTMPAGNCLTP